MWRHRLSVRRATAGSGHGSLTGPGRARAWWCPGAWFEGCLGFDEPALMEGVEPGFRDAVESCCFAVGQALGGDRCDEELVAVHCPSCLGTSPKAMGWCPACLGHVFGMSWNQKLLRPAAECSGRERLLDEQIDVVASRVACQKAEVIKARAEAGRAHRIAGEIALRQMGAPGTAQSRIS